MATDESGGAAILDRHFTAKLARASAGVSPVALGLAIADWTASLLLAPARTAELAQALPALWWDGLTHPEERVVDRRFADAAWNTPPFDMIAAQFLAIERWWASATVPLPGVVPCHARIVGFVGRQLLDMVSPANFIATNPAVHRRLVETAGKCLLDGAAMWIDDARRLIASAPPAGAEAFAPGDKVACTPGKVVFRNRLIELIQYQPTTAEIDIEPLLIVPAWIMKYYVLDLSPANSLVRWLVAQGVGVFMISWRNPDARDRDLGFDDYRTLGVMAAIDAITAITGQSRLHAAGYCLGGTLLAVTAAAMAGRQDQRLASLSLFAAQTDFSEPGELGLFIDEAQVHYLEALMWAQGYLDSRQMGGAFQMLRSNELIWSRLVHEYLMGERPPMNDLMAWNADGTRLPQRMHGEYLRAFFLQDDLVRGRLRVDGRTVSIDDIRAPMFVVATERDHIAPWRSVYKVHGFSEGEISFVLASGGHNAGIVAPPAAAGQRYRLGVHEVGALHLDPESWLAAHPARAGSWWPAWRDWLRRQSSGTAPAIDPGNAATGYPPLGEAPGANIFER